MCCSVELWASSFTLHCSRSPVNECLATVVHVCMKTIHALLIVSALSSLKTRTLPYRQMCHLYWWDTTLSIHRKSILLVNAKVISFRTGPFQ